VPNTRLPRRQAKGPSPNSSIDPAITSFASCGCSELGSSPAGAPEYGACAGGARPAITLAAFT
jgi:hypothetical protein